MVYTRAADQIQISDQIVGLALESTNDPANKRINSIVGLDHSQAIKTHILSDMQSTISDQEKDINELKKEIKTKDTDMQSTVKELKKEIDLLKEILLNKG